MNHLLFVYGSLKSEKLQKILLNKSLKSFNATLKNFAIYETKEKYYYIHNFNGENIKGLALFVTDNDFKVLDLWEEIPYYKRKLVTIYNESDVAYNAYTYIKKHDTATPIKLKNNSAFGTKSLDEILIEAQKFMLEIKNDI